ncbi:MAG: ribbon-helix-helix domain-containing protein [Candidatus Pacearchaeota archaeon]|nr:ribbon-helix-helix domain-containing protein [Candidatus Pacearchaeota archaeon]
MESISLKLEKAFLQNIEKAMKKYNYSTKTEFIREAIRDKIKDLEEDEKEEDNEKEEKEAKSTPEIRKELRQIPSYI